MTTLLLALPAALAAQQVHAGDRLVVKVFGAEEPLADTLLVAENGSVTLPRLGNVAVTQFSAASLPDSLRARYAVYLKNPTVDVTVLRRVIVVGEVKKPDIYYVDLNATLPDVIAHAGGVTEYSNNKVSLRRGSTVTPIPDWETKPTPLAELQSGDQIVVGRRPWIVQNLFTAISTLAVLTSVIVALKR